MSNSILSLLDQLGISYQHFTHEPVFTCEEGVDIYAQHGITGGHVKSLFLRNKKGSQHYLAMVLADKQVDLKELSSQVEDRKLGFASPERLDKYLCVKPGSVSPLALIHDTERHVKVIFDADVQEMESLHIHPGINTESVVLAVSDLQKYVEHLEYEIQFIEFWGVFALQSVYVC